MVAPASAAFGRRAQAFHRSCRGRRPDRWDRPACAERRTSMPPPSRDRGRARPRAGRQRQSGSRNRARRERRRRAGRRARARYRARRRCPSSGPQQAPVPVTMPGALRLRSALERVRGYRSSSIPQCGVLRRLGGGRPWTRRWPPSAGRSRVPASRRHSCRAARSSPRPASRRTLRWWLIVGWLTVQHSLKSQAQTQSVSASWRTKESRTGSARAERRRTSGSMGFIVSRVYRPPSILTRVDILLRSPDGEGGEARMCCEPGCCDGGCDCTCC